MAKLYSGGANDNDDDDHDDLEAELMDLESNEHAYLPPQPILRHSFSASMRSSSTASSSSSSSTTCSANSSGVMPAGAHSYQTPHTPHTPHAADPRTVQASSSASSSSSAGTHYQQQQMLRAVVDQRHAVQQQARDRFQPSGVNGGSGGGRRSSVSSSSLSSSLMSTLVSSFTSSLGLQSAPESHDSIQSDPAQRKQAALTTITRLRQQQIAACVLSADATSIRARQRPTGDANIDAMAQMIAKLDAVVEASLDELQVAPAAALWTQVLQELPPQESDYVAKAADETFAEQMKYCAARKGEHEVHACIEHHLEVILASSAPTRNGQSMGKSMHHSLGLLLRDFRGVFLTCYEHIVAQHDVAQVAAVLPLVTADVLQFAAILVQLLLFKYAFLAPWKHHVRRCVLAVLFDLLQPTLHGLYVGAFSTEDTVMEAIASRKRETPLADFGITPVFRLDGSWQSGGGGESAASSSPEASRQHAMCEYGTAIYRLNNLASIRSPWAKVEMLARICRDIDAAIKAHYAQQAVQPPPEEININAEALRAILAFALVSAPSMCLHVFSQLVILSSFLPETFETREEGFALATFTAAVQLVARLP